MPTFAKNKEVMKNFRTLVTSIMLTLGSIVATADDYQFLTVSQADGKTNFAVSNIQKITFDTSNMLLHLSDGTIQSLPLSSLQKMFFTDGGTIGISPISSTKSKLHFADGMLRVEVATGEHVELYNMKGERVFSNNQSGTYDMNHLPKGVFIVKVGQEAKKIINR